MHNTEHAQSRMQQRVVPPQVVEHVLDFGRMTRNSGRNGCRADVYFMDRRERAALEKTIGEGRYASLEGKLNVYVVSVMTDTWSRSVGGRGRVGRSGLLSELRSCNTWLTDPRGRRFEGPASNVHTLRHHLRRRLLVVG